LDKQRELRRYRRLMTLAGATALIATFGSLYMLSLRFPLLVAYSGSALVGMPFLVLLWRLESRYSDVLFRDDL
jgi:hypothetical protein